MLKLLCATAMSVIIISSPALSQENGQLRGELSRGEDGKIKVTPFPKASYASCSAIENAPAYVRAIVEPIAMELGLDTKLVMAVIAVESNFNNLAQSDKFAQGLMQIIPSTQKMLGVKNPFDPIDNISGGARYLRQLLDLHNGSVPLTLSSYNSGPGNTLKYGGISQIKETISYVAKVQGLLNCKSGMI